MLRNIINAIGVWLTQLKSRNLIRARANAAQLDTLAESKLKNIPQITKLDASYTNKPKNLGNLDLDEFMKTPGGTTAKVKTSSGSGGNDDNSNNRKTPGSGNNATSKASAKSSSKRVHDNNSKKRSLDTAIDRQRDFLNGFVKK
jgi:hypothetical protein